MNELTISYGLLAPQARASQDLHILPITKILYPSGQKEYFLTCSRDGSVIKHKCDPTAEPMEGKRMQAHSDWVSDIIQVGHNKFITVSHDFSIVLLTLHDGLDSWETKIIGDHEDYIKCIVHIPTNDDQFLFATGGLDRKVKVWSLELNEATLLNVFDNAQVDDTGSIYAMAAIANNSEGKFDLVVGDCNGDLIFYSSQNRTEFARIHNAHHTNIKVLKILNDSTRLVSTCSDGFLSIWDLNQKHEIPQKLASFNWGCPIWRIYGRYLNQLYVGDSKGRINRADFSRNDKTTMTQMYQSETDSHDVAKHIKQGGILDIMVLSNEILLFSNSTDSNLYRLDLRDNNLEITKGGFALTKSSLLTNRRHVITENTKGEIQRWDILICELLDTFDPSEGTFDQVVSKYTSKEILSHWCTVSVKVGMLFIKLNSRILNTEVYGSSLENYKVVNDVDLNPDERYNLGKIVVNSLFNEFLTYEIQKDKSYRKNLVSRKKESLFSYKDGIATQENVVCSADSKSKEKKKKPAFYRFGSTTPTAENGASSSSAPSTPVFTGMLSNIPIDEQPLLPPPTTSAGEKIFSDVSEFGNPTLSKSSEGRALSSGSLISRKLRLLRTYSSSRTGNGTTTPAEPQAISSDLEDSYTEDENPSESVVWNQSYHTENYTSEQVVDTLHAKLNSTETSGITTNVDNNNNAKKKTEDYMLDLINQLHDTYKLQYSANSSSLKLLTRKLPETKIIRDDSSPVIRVKNGVLLVVHCWRKGSCGGRVLFSTYLPASRNVDDENSSILLEGEEDCDNHSNEEEEKLGKYDLADYEYGNGMNRRQIFEQLEQNLPYWFAKVLLCDTINTKKQPKLNFVITPWRDNEPPPTSPTTQAQPPHHRLKFGRSKSTDILSGSSELPKIADSNAKLVAPGMIKVKKIKVYIVDRFETKTPEMKAKTEPGEWLELLCKNQVLDNDMTLSTVRTLYWKSQGDIIFEYRRKVVSQSISSTGDGIKESK